jgi:hypothetical protein
MWIGYFHLAICCPLAMHNPRKLGGAQTLRKILKSNWLVELVEYGWVPPSWHEACSMI